MLHKTLYVYKHVPWVLEGYDPTNGGISNRLDKIEVFSADATNSEIAAWCLKKRVRPSEVFRLNKRILWGEKRYFIEPVKKPRWVLGPMFGGNYADSGDITWAKMIDDRFGYPVPIHDRFETPEEYNMLSG